MLHYGVVSGPLHTRHPAQLRFRVCCSAHSVTQLTLTQCLRDYRKPLAAAVLASCSQLALLLEATVLPHVIAAHQQLLHQLPQHLRLQLPAVMMLLQTVCTLARSSKTWASVTQPSCLAQTPLLGATALPPVAAAPQPLPPPPPAPPAGPLHPPHPPQGLPTRPVTSPLHLKLFLPPPLRPLQQPAPPLRFLSPPPPALTLLAQSPHHYHPPQLWSAPQPPSAALL